MRELGEKIFESGYDAKAILLPGHGTSPDDLEKTQWTEWSDAVLREYDALKEKYRNIIVCGQSMGGVLGLYLSTSHPVSGVVVISSGIKLHHWLLNLIPILKFFMRHKKKKHGPDVRNPEIIKTEVHYNLMPLRSILQLKKLLGATRERLAKVTCPVLIIHAREDHTFQYENQEILFRSVSSTTKKKVTLENSYHLATLDYDKAIVQRETIAFVRSLCP